jgi:26S proteasome regulatory subunit N7
VLSLLISKRNIVILILRELSAFIASRKLNCKIDKTSGLVESQKVDKRNHLYQTALKKV